MPEFTTEYWVSQCAAKDAEIKELKKKLAEAKAAGAGSKELKEATEGSDDEDVVVYEMEGGGEGGGDGAHAPGTQSVEVGVIKKDPDDVKKELEEIKRDYKLHTGKAWVRGGGDNKHVTFSKDTPDPLVKSSDSYNKDTSNLVRDKDLNNVDVLLSTLVQEMQDVKSKVGVIERAVTPASMPLPRMPASNFNLDTFKPLNSSFGKSALDSDYARDKQATHEAFEPTSENKNHYRTAYQEKSLKLDQLQSQLSSLRKEQFKLKSLRTRQQKTLEKLPKSTSKPLSSYHRCKRYCHMAKPAHSITKYGKDAFGGNRAHSAADVSRKERENSEDEFKEIYQEYESINTSLSGIGSEEDYVYKGIVRDSDDFDWIKGVTIGSRAFSEETLERGNSYLRKVARTYDYQHPYEKIYYSRYNKDTADADLEMIERALRSSFIETDDGLEYRYQSGHYNY